MNANKIRGLLRNLYRWIKSLFMNNKMTDKEVYEKIYNFVSEDINSLKKYFETQGDYQLFIGLNPKFSSIEFKIGSQYCLLRFDILIGKPTAAYSTYLLIPNTDNFPNHRLKHIPELDLQLDLNGTRQFRESKVFSAPASFGNTNIFTTSDITSNFSESYIEQVTIYIKENPQKW